MRTGLRALVVALTSAWITVGFLDPLGAQEAQKYSITPDGQELIRHLAKQDKFVADLPKGVSSLSAINSLLSGPISGPVSLVLTWNKGLIAGWKSANKRLAEIEKKVTCNDITLYLADSPSDAQFFDQLYSARGCDD